MNTEPPLIKVSNFSWKRFFIEGKLSLSLGGVVLVLISVTASVGVFGFAGVPATLIIFEILPFLVSKAQQKIKLALS